MSHVGGNSLVDELCADPEGLGHVAQSEGAVGLQQLAVGLDPHLAHVVTVVWRKEPVLLHLLLHHGCDTKTRSEPMADRAALTGHDDGEKEPHPATGRRRSNGTRTGRRDTGAPRANCAAPPRSPRP